MESVAAQSQPATVEEPAKIIASLTVTADTWTTVAVIADYLLSAANRNANLPPFGEVGALVEESRGMFGG